MIAQGHSLEHFGRILQTGENGVNSIFKKY